MSAFRHNLLVWVWNLINASISGMAAAAIAGMGGQVIGAASFTFRQLWAAALGGAAVSAFNYVRENRLPKLEE